MKITIIGAGAWGTAIAASATKNPNNQVTLLTHTPQDAQEIKASQENKKYLPNIKLPAELQIKAAWQNEKDTQEADLIIIGTPISALREILEKLQKQITKNQAPHIAWLCKGFENKQNQKDPAAKYGLLPHEIQKQIAPDLKTATLTGPSFAQEVAKGLPAALVAASTDPKVVQTIIKGLHSKIMRIYASDDIIGAEVGGAVKNILAIATGLSDGLNLGLNARAALITRGLAEMSRLGIALGAKPETFTGLSGMGDLVLTATGDLSRNRKIGLLIAQGMTLEKALASLGHVAEGVYCARTVWQRAQHLGVEMPITQVIHELLNGDCKPQQAVEKLMGREPKSENQ